MGHVHAPPEAVPTQPHLGREYELAAAMGVSAEDAYLAGLAGALCDSRTRARLTELPDAGPLVGS